MKFNLIQLENRTNPTITFSNGMVEVIGTNDADEVTVYHNSAVGFDNISIKVVSSNKTTKRIFHSEDVLAVRATLLDGNDSYTNNLISSFIIDNVYAGSGDDIVIGGHGGGRLYGDEGNDNITSQYHQAYDKFNLTGGAGEDIITCSEGVDWVLYDSKDTVINFDNTEDFYIYAVPNPIPPPIEPIL